MEQELDCRGMQCPLPIVRLREAFGGSRAGDTILMRVSTEATRGNVSSFLRDYHGMSVDWRQDGDSYVARIVCPDVSELGKVEASASDLCGSLPGVRGAVVLCATDSLGQGDGTLGVVLMKGFLSTLEGWDPLPESLLLLNGGVRLTDSRFGAVPTLQSLEGLGVEVLVCGTCLDFYGLQGRVGAGRVTNMYEISSRVNGASRVVRL